MSGRKKSHHWNGDQLWPPLPIANGGGLNLSSGGELKLFIDWKRNTLREIIGLVFEDVCCHKIPGSVEDPEFQRGSANPKGIAKLLVGKIWLKAA